MAENIVTYTIDEENFGDRIDVFVSEVLTDYTRSHAQKLIDGEFVKINGLTVSKSSKTLKIGDLVEITIPEVTPIEILPQDISIDIVYQDEYLAVINKQQGLTVHPANGIYVDTLVNALLFHIKDLSGINGKMRPGIVHRLDKDTSGLMLVAKNDFAHQSLANQISTKECKRTYYALVEGVVKTDEGTIDKPIGRSEVDRKKMAIDINGRNAVTHYKVLKRYKKNTLMQFNLVTGRTHQIRVHTKYLGHPIVGDTTYGFIKQRFNLSGQLLHSKEIEFTHPYTKERMKFTSELPDYFQKILKIVENESK